MKATMALWAGFATLSLLAQNRVTESKVHVQDERQTLNRGRLGTQDSMPNGPLTLTGTLVDGGCRDRTEPNLLRPPIPLSQKGSVETADEASSQNSERSKTGYATAGREPQSAAVSAHGITVDAQTLQSERSDVLAHQVPELMSRQEDPSCAITGRTSNFGFLMNNGRLLNLQSGGNVLAWQAIQSSNAGQMMLNGNGPAFKPRATIKGMIRGDRLIVDDLQLQ